MAAFTIELKKVVALHPDDQGLNDYPVYKNAPTGFRAELNKKILDHFWNREIGLESISMWRFNMRRKMAEIMPYYNQLYASELIKIDPISTMNIAGKSKADSTQKNDASATSASTGEQNTTSAQNSTSKTVASDYPQTALDEDDGSQYATSSQQSIGAGTGAGSASETRTGNDTREENGVATQNGETNTVGYTGAPSDLLMRYRMSFLNIDMLVISDLEELFMSVWDTGDSYTNGNY